MQAHRWSLCAILLIVGSAGCTQPSPPPVVEPQESPEVKEKARAEELKRLDGNWVLKSSLMSGGLGGTYSQSSSDGAQAVYRIRGGVMEMFMGDDQWREQSKLSIGAEPECLMCTTMDAQGQTRLVPKRYRLEADTLTIVQDNQYPDQLPESFDLQAGADRQRQINTYVRKK